MLHALKITVASCALALTAGLAFSAAAADRAHNVILFIPDGLRTAKVTPQTAPTMAAIRDKGVNFANSHSIFPTFTTANASAMATGHYLGDSGDFSNTIYTRKPIAAAGGSPTPFLENNPVLGEVDQNFGGDYLNEETLLKAARDAGFGTAAIGKLGPVLIFDHTERTGEKTIVIDDSTGTPDGIPLSAALQAKLAAAGLPLKAPGRGDNGKAGDIKSPGTTVANLEQQQYFADVATKAVLPMMKESGKPFVLVFWSRDPDGTQHNQGDSLNALSPGINGPTSLASIKNADDNLAAIQKALTVLGLAATTDIFVTADHGFSTISKQTETSASAKVSYEDVPKGFLPPGFLSIDIAKTLGMSLFDPDDKNKKIEEGKHSAKRGNALIGSNAADPEVVVAANGGSDLIYVPRRDVVTIKKTIDMLLTQDYVSGLFVDDTLGEYPGTLPLSSINFKGKAVTPVPAIVVNFKTFAMSCPEPTECGVEVADTTLQQGQGMHGSFSRADTRNFMAAIGPDFKKGFIDKAPVSNADVGKTLAHILGLRIKDNGSLVGRVIGEAQPNGTMPLVLARTERSAPAANGLRTVLEYQMVGSTKYFDAAGFPGRTLGLKEQPGDNRPGSTTAQK
jgi:predicted AlkP superfamily pyrophosphatase or phosphodiesterase